MRISAFTLADRIKVKIYRNLSIRKHKSSHSEQEVTWVHGVQLIRTGRGNHGGLVIVQQSDDGNDRAPYPAKRQNNQPDHAFSPFILLS